MPTFFARRYMRPAKAVGRTEKTVGAVILLLVAAVIAAFVYQIATDRNYLFDVGEHVYRGAPASAVAARAGAGPAADDAARNLFPEVELDGWHRPQQVERFNADSLYVKINGRADAYLKFGVVALTFGHYDRQDDAERTVDVYWYDMGTPANALGMYRSEQAPDATPVSLGQAGYQVGGAVFFCQGSSYVQVMPSGLGDADARAALTIAERLAERIKPK